MNAQTAQALNIQASRAFVGNITKPRRLFGTPSIHFKDRTGAKPAASLINQFNAYLACSKETHCPTARLRYHAMAIGFIECLLLAGSIDLAERTRLIALFNPVA